VAASVRTAFAKTTSLSEVRNWILIRAPFFQPLERCREIVSFEKKNTIFAQGHSTDGLLFIQEGNVQLSVVSEAGKEATLGILREGDFFEEGGLLASSSARRLQLP